MLLAQTTHGPPPLFPKALLTSKHGSDSHPAPGPRVALCLPPHSYRTSQGTCGKLGPLQCLLQQVAPRTLRMSGPLLPPLRCHRPYTASLPRSCTHHQSLRWEQDTKGSPALPLPLSLSSLPPGSGARSPARRSLTTSAPHLSPSSSHDSLAQNRGALLDLLLALVALTPSPPGSGPPGAC